MRLIHRSAGRAGMGRAWERAWLVHRFLKISPMISEHGYPASPNRGFRLQPDRLSAGAFGPLSSAACNTTRHMKTVSALIVIAGLFSASFAFGAKSQEEAYIESFHGRAGVPVPVSVVKPKISEEFSGFTVVLEFTVDATGTPRNVRPRQDALPEALVNPLVDAVAQWKFTPLSANGAPVEAKVALPMVIVSDGDTSRLLATR